MASQDSDSKYWTLSSPQLAIECHNLTEKGAAVHSNIDTDIRNQATQLCDSWQLALQMPDNDFFARSERAVQIASLRKRTIEILVQVDRNAS